ncbi:uncharacterized protein SPSC_02571 [Sporisorium scitamineum]|uniref:Uncharacterized protein n=1 Tax=Sporisorium scitamineum TaxID=49012 RepID=A0A0F7RWN5_9BASI|nr:hypothetical protein [Sporisorium scitamineum]CDU23942.1 uncharacterized protein SPSC_02571 [Sporisorium scitamineum]
MESDAATAAPWTWRLDQHSGSASLGPSSSATNISPNPLSSLSHASTSVSSTDEIFWQGFRPLQKRETRSEKKRTRLHRFDSDDEEQEGDVTIKVKKEDGEPVLEAGASPGVDSDEEDAGGFGHMSSEDSDDSEHQDAPSQAQSSGRVETEDRDVKNTSTATIKGPHERRSHRRADDASYSTQLIAQTIHRHALVNPDVDQSSVLSTTPPPSPLTYKETVRLVRLIAMLFRFPKSSRRIIRRRQRLHHPDDPPTSSPSPAPEPPPSSTPPATSSTLIELKPKYLTSSSTASTSHKPRIIAHVHPDDALPHSDAVLKLLALIPAALPGRVGCAEWIAALAVKARRDEYGNILLPSSAYTTAGVRDDSVVPEGDRADQTIKTEEVEGGGKVTRSMRQKLGREAPAIPLPQFWRRRAVKQEEADTPLEASTPTIDATPTEESEVDALTSSATPLTDSQSSLPSTPDVHTPQQRRRKAINFSKLLAERMREKRQAKTLLLRTHQSLRKRKSDDAGGVEDAGGGEGEKEEGVEMDAETIANTLANSGKVTADALAAVEQGKAENQKEVNISKTRATQGREESVEIKQEDV